MGKFDTYQLRILLSPDPTFVYWLGHQQLIAFSLYRYLFFGNISITHHTTRALQITALDGREFWPSKIYLAQ